MGSCDIFRIKMSNVHYHCLTKTVRINWGQSYLLENSDVTDLISPTQKWSCDLLCECKNTKHLCNKFLSNQDLVIFLIDFITTLPGLKMSDNTSYATPLNSRYSSQEMKYNFSAQKKFSTWRQVWPLQLFFRNELLLLEFMIVCVKSWRILIESRSIKGANAPCGL